MAPETVFAQPPVALASTLRAVLCMPPAVPPIASLAEWRRRDREAASCAPVDHATLAGFAADRIGYAFASGYQAALRALDPSLGVVASFCASEQGGAHPRAIEATLRRSDGHWVLDGGKRWATLAPIAEVLLVVASTGIVEGRNQLRLARVASARTGVAVETMPAPAFAPEIPHGEIRFTGVLLTDDEVLPGDGYERYLRPFRTIEDVHVHAALLAYLVRVARQQEWPFEIAEELVALLGAVHGLAREDPSAPEVHVALGGVLRLGRPLFDRVDGLWRPEDPAGRDRWLRDSALFGVAEHARAARLASAWARLAGEEPRPPTEESA